MRLIILLSIVTTAFCCGCRSNAVRSPRDVATASDHGDRKHNERRLAEALAGTYCGDSSCPVRVRLINHAGMLVASIHDRDDIPWTDTAVISGGSDTTILIDRWECSEEGEDSTQERHRPLYLGYSRGTLTFQNYGNSMNMYNCFWNCGTKFGTLYRCD